MAVSAFAQSNPHNVARGDAAFVEQAPEQVGGAQEATAAAPAPEQGREQPQNLQPAQVDASSKVYFPEPITPQATARARAQTRSAQQEQLPSQPAPANAALSQIPSGQQGGQDGQNVAQLTEGDTSSALAQLSAAERQVLLEAVEGTDICERGSDIPALQELCAGRIETRSAEFTQETRGSAEDNLLGGGLDSARIATLEAAIARLARNSGSSDDFSNQVIASVALGSATLTDAQATSAEGDPTADLTPETQAFVNAIVQQLGGN